MITKCLKNSSIWIAALIVFLPCLRRASAQSSASTYCSQNAPACTQAMDELDKNDAELSDPSPNGETPARFECERDAMVAVRDLATFFKEMVAADMSTNKKLTKQQAMWYETNRYFGKAFAKAWQQKLSCASKAYGKIAEPQ